MGWFAPDFARFIRATMALNTALKSRTDPINRAVTTEKSDVVNALTIPMKTKMTALFGYGHDIGVERRETGPAWMANTAVNNTI